jgi:cold shock CspA family protein
MNSGRIKWFNPYQNYGYILLTDGTEVFFHADALAEGAFVGHLGPGQTVSFDLMETRMGFEACNIHPTHTIYR